MHSCLLVREATTLVALRQVQQTREVTVTLGFCRGGKRQLRSLCAETSGTKFLKGLSSRSAQVSASGVVVVEERSLVTRPRPIQ
jgi:hypothetical protein